jgi:hypothetical protein
VVEDEEPLRRRGDESNGRRTLDRSRDGISGRWLDIDKGGWVPAVVDPVGVVLSR